MDIWIGFSSWSVASRFEQPNSSISGPTPVQTAFTSPFTTISHSTRQSSAVGTGPAAAACWTLTSTPSRPASSGPQPPAYCAASTHRSEVRYGRIRPQA
eukprot:scaffold65774_cov61-Phaeocystis_antarctica.AAC.2